METGKQLSIGKIFPSMFYKNRDVTSMLQRVYILYPLSCSAILLDNFPVESGALG